MLYPQASNMSLIYHHLCFQLVSNELPTPSFSWRFRFWMFDMESENFIFIFILFWRERACERAGEWGRGWGERENPKQAPHSAWSQCRPWSHVPGIMTWAKIKTQMLNLLSYSGAPQWILILKVILNESSHQGRLVIPTNKRPLERDGGDGVSVFFLHSAASWTEAMWQVAMCYQCISIWRVSGQIMFHHNRLSLASPSEAF